MAYEFVDNDFRDQVLNNLLLIPENKVSSATFFLTTIRSALIANRKTQSGVRQTSVCSFATSALRNTGRWASTFPSCGKSWINTFNNLSSLKMDKWKAKELKRMELGGNKRATEYYE